MCDTVPVAKRTTAAIPPRQDDYIRQVLTMTNENQKELMESELEKVSGGLIRRRELKPKDQPKSAEDNLKNPEGSERKFSKE